MSTSAAATQITPPAIITHSVAVIRGEQHADVSVYHARTPDARISFTFGGTLMVIYSCHAAQGLLEAFAAARGHLALVPREIPAPRTDPDATGARATLAVEWTRRPRYAAVPQSAKNRLGTGVIHWVDLHVGPITWQIRDQAGLRSVLDVFTRMHRTAIAVFLDGEQHRADPTADDYRAA